MLNSEIFFFDTTLKANNVALSYSQLIFAAPKWFFRFGKFKVRGMGGGVQGWGKMCYSSSEY